MCVFTFVYACVCMSVRAFVRECVYWRRCMRERLCVSVCACVCAYAVCMCVGIKAYEGAGVWVCANKKARLCVVF